MPLMTVWTCQGIHGFKGRMMRIRNIVLISVVFTGLLAMSSGLCAAAPLTQKQLDQMTPKQLGAVPIVDLMAVVVPEAPATDIRAILELWLRTLGYYQGWPDGADTQAFHRAVKGLQTATGYTPTGILTFHQAGELDRQYAYFLPSDGLSPPRSDGIYAYAGNIYASGIWLDQGKQLPSQLNYSHIVCHNRSDCDETGFRTEEAPLGTTYHMTMFQRHWTISRSDPRRILVKTREGRCVAATLTIDLKTQSATLSERGSGDRGCELPSHSFGDYNLANSASVTKDIKAARNKTRDEALAPRYRALLAKLRNSPAWQIMYSLGILAEPADK
jgi:Putative peptidoglycan binding domain